MARRKMKDHYRKLSFITDLGGIQNALGEMHGFGFPKQPPLNCGCQCQPGDPVLDEHWFCSTIKAKIAGHPENGMEYPFYGERIFEEALVGFVRGDDPIFEEFKEIIGPHHFTPWEIMAWQAESNGVEPPSPEDISVVSFVMPITKATRDDNRKAHQWPAERWAQTRLHGELFSQLFVREIVTYLMSRGILAVAPDVTPKFNKKRYPKVGWASPWSHRHVAYAAGLGTFGMHDFLITEKGCAHRLGSFVVNLRLQPNRERSEDIHANCLHYQGVKCLKCMERCPVGAISEDGAHDKEKCYKKVKDSLRYCNKHYHIFIYGCGLCATGVPCENQIPKPLQKKKDNSALQEKTADVCSVSFSSHSASGIISSVKVQD
ncbi:epoxyqueuosine reductase [Desulfatibacillum aliphaticivorans]|uniref:epoxyqueuosine reductase n=1 Tax=Desulfatibacillum aliphaticivorans TaxID=218208 RepID=UPI0004014B78|nr:epoxyqueuosine reductase [Desulfatibacillum aliphaticivorans]